MNNSEEIIKKAQNKLNEKKRKAEREFTEKISPLYENDEFSALDKQLTLLMIDNAKKEINGEEKDIQTEQNLKKPWRLMKKPLIK